MSAALRPSDASTPTYLTRLVGREDELAWLAERFAGGERLVTLFGPPGVGKTRLAVEAMAIARSAGSDATFCDLSEARTLDDVAARVLTSLVGGRSRAQSDAAAAVTARLEVGPPTLLVLDNFDHLVGVAGALVATWSAATLGSTVLVTSREVLRVAGESALDLAPLALPASADLLEGSDAGRLLLDAIARYQRTPLGPDDRQALVALLGQLEGLPLAIEIVAPRVALLGARAVLSRLTDVLASPRSTDSRAQTLHHAIGWSWDLLDEAEQRALVTCTCFRGGFSLPAFEACVGTPGTPGTLERADRPEGPVAVTTLASLRDKSLVRAMPTREGEPRYGVYSAIASFIAHRAAAADIEDAAVRHGAHFTELARALVGRDDAPALSTIAIERANLRVAVERALAAADADARDARDARGGRGALAMLAVLGGLDAGEPVAPSLALFDRAEALLAEDAESGWATLAHAQLRDQLGHYEVALAASERGLAIARKNADLRLLARATLRMGVCTLHVTWGSAAPALSSRSKQLLEEAVAAADRAGDDAAAAFAFGVISFEHFSRGAHDEALRFAALAIGRADAARAPVIAAASRCQAAIARLARDDIAGADVDSRIGCELAEAHGGAPLIAYARALRGLVEHALGRLDSAEPLYRAAITAHTYLGLSIGERYYRAMLAVLLVEQHRDDEAVREIGRADRIVGRDKDRVWRDLARALVQGVVATRSSTPMDLEAALGAGEGADPRYDRARSLVTALVGAARDRRAGSAPSPDLREQLATARAARGTGEPVENVFLGFLERSLAAAAEPAHVPPRDAGELLVQRHGLWFQPPGEDRVSCHARQALRLLLVALATSRIERPGDPSGLDALRDAGWPGEKMTPVSARNRIKQSIAVLRRLGAHVEWVEGGYLFSPALRIRLVD